MVAVAAWAVAAAWAHLLDVAWWLHPAALGEQGAACLEGLERGGEGRGWPWPWAIVQLPWLFCSSCAVSPSDYPPCPARPQQPPNPYTIKTNETAVASCFLRPSDAEAALRARPH